MSECDPMLLTGLQMPLFNDQSNNEAKNLWKYWNRHGFNIIGYTYFDEVLYTHEYWPADKI